MLYDTPGLEALTLGPSPDGSLKEMNFKANSPSMKQTAMSPSFGSIDLSTTRTSPSFTSASTIESPTTRAKKVAAGWRTSSLLRSMNEFM